MSLSVIGLGILQNNTTVFQPSLQVNMNLELISVSNVFVLACERLLGTNFFNFVFSDVTLVA